MPATAAPTLSRRALGRATLARQLLLGREQMTPAGAIARLAGLQAQERRPPFVGLWSRLEGFERGHLLEALHARTVVRVTAMRGTLHLLTADDYRALRPALQPGLSQGLQAVLRDRLDAVNVPELVAEAAAFLQAAHTFTEVRDHLMRLHPDGDERAQGYAVRMSLPAVMVPDASPWGYPSDAPFTDATRWLGTPLDADASPALLVRRYLAAFGPASVADAQAWAGLKGLKATFEALRPELATFRDERGRELFDLPDAPRPPEETAAPVRFLPDYDNLVLAHDDRTRVVPEAHRGRIVTKNLKVNATFLVDGLVAGTWRTERKGKAATLVVEPFEGLTAEARQALAAEAEPLVRFAEPEATSHAIRFTEPA